MKNECKTPGGLNALVSALFITLATASHAYANSAPGPLAFVSMFSLVIMLVALTCAGGGYRVAKRLDEARYPSKVKRAIRKALEFIAGLVLFFFGIMASIVGVLILSLYAIGRGVKMIQWSKEAEKEGVRPAHVEGANPRRLKLAGIMLIALTLLVFGYSLVNIEEVTGIADYRKRGYAAMLNSDARIAKTAADQYLVENPKAGVVTCADMEKAGYKPSSNVACSSDMTATSGGIRITGPDRWKLKKPVATITFSGEFIPAEQ